MPTSSVHKFWAFPRFVSVLLALVVVGAVVAPRAAAAGTSPTISFDFKCNGTTPQAGWTATNTDLGAHVLDVVTNYGGADIASQTILAAGNPSTGSLYGAANGAHHRIRIYENAVLLADSELWVADVSLPTCWKLWVAPEPSEEPEGGWGPAGPPLVEFFTSCASGNISVEAVLTNVDGLAHSTHAEIETLGDDPESFGLDIELLAGKLHAGTGGFIYGPGTIVRMTVTEGATLLATSPMLLLTNQGATCHIEVAPVAETTTTTATPTTTEAAQPEGSPPNSTTSATTTTTTTATTTTETRALPQTGPSTALPTVVASIAFLVVGLFLAVCTRRRQVVA